VFGLFGRLGIDRVWKPRITALEELASTMSSLVIVPTARCNTLSSTFSDSNLFSAIDNGFLGSLRVRLDDHAEHFGFLLRQGVVDGFQRNLRPTTSRSSRLASSTRFVASSRASFSFWNTMNSRTRFGTPLSPSTRTACDGPASFSRRPSSLISAAPARNTVAQHDIANVQRPLRTSTVATGPPGSIRTRSRSPWLCASDSP